MRPGTFVDGVFHVSSTGTSSKVPGCKRKTDIDTRTWRNRRRRQNRLPPFGMLDANGVPEGFEHDLAADIAKRLGVQLRKVSVTGSNRLQKLQEGVIDLVIATTGDTEERRQIVTMIEPNYYASGVTLFMPPTANIKDWADTRGHPVCATQGSYFNRVMQQRYLMELQMYNNARDAKLAVKDGRCIGYLFDNTAVINDLANPEWKGYKAPLPPTLNTPWAMAISKNEKGTEFEKMLGDIVADWHRSGFLQEREKAWGIAPSKFLADTHALWQKEEGDKTPFCHRMPEGSWRAECRNQVFLTSTDVGGLAQLGLWLNETTGINLTLVYDSFDRSQFFYGLVVTLVLTVLCITCSLLLGWAGAVFAESRISLLSVTARLLGTTGRMTPPLLCMYLLLFGIGAILSESVGIALPAFGVVVFCLSVYTGAGVMTALLDAATAYRLQHGEFRLRFANTSQIARLASGSVTASLINVSKATMMASAVAVPELLSATTSIINERGNVGVMMNALLLTFLLIIFAVVRVIRQLEQKILARVA
ncbi:transporter substrate-binding domain-containing protein [Undibacterium sp. KW1]|uniref:transporter substrate-binding domain-containing protein n=1 Tax=Undibacterium sp. KW1 TaxID=2058624 RepID=UPI0021035EC3|nr:transporter substrate-binding domain-containing protein [Undibacterium sp. KW1]